MKAIILTGIAVSLVLFPRISLCEIDTEAVPGEDQWVYEGDTVTLDGSASASTDTYHWEQVIVGDEPVVVLDNQDPPDGVTHFEAPPLDVGVMLTFRLTVTGPTGTDSAETHVYVRAANAPQVAPQNIRTYRGHLSFRLEWDPLIDAEEYRVGLKLGPGVYFWFWTDTTHYRLSNLAEGQAMTVAVKGWNSYGDGVRSEDITLVPMRNYALPEALRGTKPPSEYVYTVSHFDIAGTNDTQLNDHNDSWDGNPKSEDYWGYLWAEPLYFDFLVYFTGTTRSDGGWFTDLTIQYTEDGTTWKDATNVEISPAYDFTDSPAGREDFTRYDISFTAVRGTGIRICGTPGGTGTFTSIAELEVYGDPFRVPLYVHGVDDEFMEGNTATLDGSPSFSTRGRIISYHWEQTSGPAVTIQDADNVTAGFQAPEVDDDTTLVFSLTVADGTEEATDSDVRIIIRNWHPALIVDVMDDEFLERSTVILDGSLSFSTRGPIVSYHWEQVSGPIVTIQDADSAVATFEAPEVDADTTLVFSLTVGDGTEEATDNDVRITIKNALTTAKAGVDQWVDQGSNVTLDGSASTSADTYHWEQVVMGSEPVVTLSNPDPRDGITTFTAPTGVAQVVTLTFRLTVTGPSGSDFDDTHVFVGSGGPPAVAPGNIRTYPGHLSFRIEWDPLIDAERYGVGFKLAPGLYFWFWTNKTLYDLLNLQEGQAITVAVKGRNTYGDGVMSEDITVIPLRNYALPGTIGGTKPPSEYVYTASHFEVTGMNDKQLDDHNDSWDDNPKSEDYWGYLWPQPMYMDHVVYFTGNLLADGGWFTDVRVQYTKDGIEWLDVPTRIVPPYDFTDAPTGRTPCQRYDMYVPTVFGRGIRICGTPGGTSSFTSISELEVLADHATSRHLIVQGVDAEFPEQSTATLDGSFTFSTRGDVTSYSWEQVSGPVVTIHNGSGAIATFEAPEVDEDTVLVFSLIASDGTETLSDDDVRITIKDTVPVLEPLMIVRSENEVTLTWQEFGDGEYTVELMNDLPNGPWQTPPGDWPITERSWTDVNVMTSADMICFYRVESDDKHTVPVGVVKVVIPKEGLTMLSVPLAAADPGLNGDPGCIGDMIKENLTGGSDVATGDKVWKWDPATQVYQTAFLIAGWGEPYDGRWWDGQSGGFSTMILHAGETFWLQTE